MSKRLPYIILIVFVASACTSIKTGALIKQTECSEQVKLIYYAAEDRISSIRFNFKFRYSNRSLKKSCIANTLYVFNEEYAESVGRPNDVVTPFVFQIIEDTLILYSNRNIENNYVNKFKSMDLIVRVSHRVDTSRTSYLELYPYLEQMNAVDTTMLEVGTLKEFKSRHPQLTEKLLGGDTIKFSIYNMKREYVDINFELPIQY